MTKIIKLILVNLFLLHPVQADLRDSYEMANLQDIRNPWLVNIRYATKINITGEILPQFSGQNNAIVTRDVAQALGKVQDQLAFKDLRLVIYNAYTPVSAVEALAEYIRAKESETNEPEYGAEYALKLIKQKRALSRASTVDVTLINNNSKIAATVLPIKRNYLSVRNVEYIDDNTLDMGTSYDSLIPLSSPNHPDITGEARANRLTLKEVMESFGFVQNQFMWWQFTYKREPFRDTYFDFEV